MICAQQRWQIAQWKRQSERSISISNTYVQQRGSGWGVLDAGESGSIARKGRHGSKGGIAETEVRGWVNMVKTAIENAEEKRMK